MSEQKPTRRERYRRQTVAEIKGTAMAQLCEGGAEAVSLNAIARSMAMSAPALYRYFASRDELLADLAADIHLALAGALEAASAQESSPVSRVRAVANAYRDWALVRPHAYRLAYETTHGSGHEHASGGITAAARRCMNVFLGVVAGAGEAPVPSIPAVLDEQIRCWNGGDDQHSLPAGTLHFGLVWWSRLHGLVSLELGKHLAATGVDTGLLYRAEIEAMLGALCDRDVFQCR